MSGRLEGKVALITGGARGMGAAHARRFAEEGAKVAITDVLDAEGEATAKEIGDAALFIHHDVTDEDAWSQVLRETTDAFGGVDVLVNNAGIFSMAPIAGHALDEYLRVIQVNQVGVFLGMRAVIPAMGARGGGSIINISSVDGLVATPMSVAYVASKFAVRGMTKVAALELASSRIRVNSIHPGGVRTPMVQSVGFDVEPMLAAAVPLQRLAEPEEVANLALFLASDESSYCTGAEFVIDGGVICGLAGGEVLNIASSPS